MIEPYKPTTPHEIAVAAAFKLFAATYAAKWSGADVPTWSMILEEATAEELLVAAKTWCRSEEWPPSPRELLSKIPRFCRCGKHSCGPCHARALDRARRSVERGSLGADFDTPERLLGAPPRAAEPRRLTP